MLRAALWLAVAVASPEAVRGLTLSRGRDLVARVAAPPPLKRIHVISVGRQGSCLALDLFERAGDGLPVLFEPLRGTAEGVWILVGPGSESKRQQVRCLYSDDPASACQGTRALGRERGPPGLVVHQGVLDELKELLAEPSHPPLVIKTTRIANLKLMAEELSPEQVDGTKFVVLVRDPRAVWASFKPFEGWAVHHIPLVCRLLAESLLTVPALADAASGHVEVAVYEEWSKDVAGWAEKMGAFFGLDSTEMVRLGRENQREPTKPEWVGNLTDSELSQIEQDRFCRAYMVRVGYRPGREEGVDYSGLRSSADLQRGLDSSEQGVLTELMSVRKPDPSLWRVQPPGGRRR